MLKSKSHIAIPPGATIKEQLENRGITQKEFAARMGMSEKHISKLINGDVALTYDVANRLEFVLGMPASFWNNLECLYREQISKVNIENSMENDKKIAVKFPIKEMALNGWIDIDNLKDKVAVVSNLRKFFEVTSLEALQNPLVTKIACRRLGETEKADFALIAWAQKAKLVARNINTNLIDLEKLKSLIPQIRKMTVMDPAVFGPELKKKLAECGIALVFLPHIGGSFLHGASFVDGKKIVVGLTIRGKDADRFWFSLFHELGHVLYGHINQQNGTTEEDERNADLFAKNILINNDDFEFFVDRNDFSESAIINFSNYVGILPGIVVGRLQKDGYIKYNRHNNLKMKYEFA